MRAGSERPDRLRCLGLLWLAAAQKIKTESGPLLSASECFCARLPGTWALSWTTMGDQAGALQALGLGIASLGPISKWADEQFGSSLGWPGVLLDLDAARSLGHYGAQGHLHLVALGLPAEEAEAILDEAGPDPGPEVSAVGRSGYLQALDRGLPLPDGVDLGWEPMCLDMGQLGCTWRCNGLEHRAAGWGLTLNAAGLLPNLEQARRACARINRPSMGAEPGLWIPVLLRLVAQQAQTS